MNRYGRLARRRSLAPAAALVPTLLFLACGTPAPEAEEHGDDHWTVTAWGPSFEIYPEADALVAGESTDVLIHVTRLDGFAPLGDGRIEAVLAGGAGEQTFAAERASRPGLFEIPVEPSQPGERDLLFRIHAGDMVEEIPAGRIRVGSAESPGALLVAPAPRGASDPGQPISFTKEEQWSAGFATGWVRTGSLAGSVDGLAKVRPPAGGETTITAPVAGVLQPGRDWPFVGLRVERETALFELAPHIAADRSLATLEAELAGLDGELSTAQTRLARLEELLALEATSRREVEEARTLAAGLEASRSAAERDLQAARSSRQGGEAGTLTLRAPFSGEIAAVSTSPGATVAAGEPLARLVETDRAWLEVALAPPAARRVRVEGLRGVVLGGPEQAPIRIAEDLRLVAVAPELSPRTGMVTALVEVPATPGLVFGSVLQADLLLPEEREGVVVPSSALVDDGGVPVVYLQLAGETFVRQEVEVIERQGDRVLVGRLIPGQRIVLAGGDAIRRSSLMATGDAHGHIH